MKNYIGASECLQKKKEYIIPCLGHFYKNPPQFIKGKMQYLYDTNNKKYLDLFAGVSVINCGHCNDFINEKVKDQIDNLQHICNIYLTENIYNLAEKLAELTPGDLKKSFFCSTGTEANEGALLLSTLYNGKNEFLALRNGLHGRTKLTMNLTGIGMWRTDPHPVGGINFAPNPYCYRCPMNKTIDNCDFDCANKVEDIISYATSNNVSAMIVEIIQGNAGIIVPPKGYFKRLKEILDKHNILLIVDEVQTGFGRTGKMFACEHYDINPDIMTMAKALGNGIPISAFIAAEKIANSYTKPGASTLGGNPVSTMAGLSVIEYINNENLLEKATHLGDYLKNSLIKLQEKYPIIGDVRGIGLMIGAEIVNPINKNPDSEKLEFIVEEMLERGFIIGKNGIARNVLAFQPPLVISKDDLDDLLNNLEYVLEKVS